MRKLSNIFLPEGCIAFGPGATSRNVERWLNRWLLTHKSFSILVVLAGTRTAEVEGISAAGSTTESRKYTAIADAELLLKGPGMTRSWPLPPLEAGVSPALISHVAVRSLEIQPFALAVGLLYMPPFPHLRIESPGLGPSECISTGKSMERKRVDILVEQGKVIGKKLKKPLVLCECVPGGTTTAQAVLTGLGIYVADLISSSLIHPPKEIKTRVVSLGLEAAGITTSTSPESLMAAVGDPFQPVAVGILLGALESNQPVFLGGGSQMIAVVALALASLPSKFHSRLIDLVSIGTTAWLAEEVLETSCESNGLRVLIDRVSDYFSVKLLGIASGLRFDSSMHQSLRDYEIGYVKEGVGVGVLTFLAQLYGTPIEELVRSCDQAFSELTKSVN